MDVSARSNRSTETAGDFVVAQIDVRTARGTDRRSGSATNLLFPFTIEALDNGAVLSFPKVLKFAENR